MPSAKASPACASEHYDRIGRTRVVFDGDTLKLRDGTKVRLVGINTPEMAHDNQPSEPFAGAAYIHLLELAGPGQSLKLRFDREPRDRYDRMLAHVFLADGTNVQASLLRHGLATTLVVPPNEWSYPCYARIENQARAARRGVWSLPSYQALPAKGLDMETRGFHIINGVVSRVGEGPSNLWINLTSQVALRVPRKELGNFPDLDLRGLAGRHIEARGWIHKRKGQLRMTVRHPAALRLVE